MKTDLLSGNILKSLLVFVFPLFLSSIFQLLYNTADMVIVGHFLGEESLESIGVCAVMFELLIGFAMGVGGGFGIVVARSYESGDKDLLKCTVTGAVVIGNGFDLKMGLKTRFRNVLEAYLLDSSSNEIIINFKKDIKKNFENWSDFESYMGEYTEKIAEDNYFQCIYDFIRFLKTYLKNEENKALFDIKEISQAFQKSILYFYNFLDEYPKKLLVV